ncbi:regulatory iron-sulfur-containing complex subunit RicT [Persicobacter psychrovividus]|uniref:PSP1 C-terminal domain-containing protein n=1 Tax=Persicobacter psychrovividus TaxID=387638 RepID=A0ABN6L995_9BACT|nr:hypothetical protein PEPS_04630 [Persicobacter psychrovividus]
MEECTTCGTDNEHAEGCGSQGSCSSGGCNKMNSFDWLSNMELPVDKEYDVIEVRFKNGRKDFFRNIHSLPITTGEAVIVDVPNGHHLGYVSMMGELVRLQMRKKKVEDNEEIRPIYRVASEKDFNKFYEVKKRETPTLFRTREIIERLSLNMKLTDIEYQADNTKATFYYSADERVDFRELIKVLASEFKIRVEMRQISLRQEAGRLGGIGSCGRELCCSTWLNEFKSVSTSSARYQNLSLNPSKLSGQCGRLKCCLNYELETYLEALQHIPEITVPLVTEKGEARLQKTDIFRRIMWFGYESENSWYSIPIDRVLEIIRMNKNGKFPATLESDVQQAIDTQGAFASDLDKLDKKYSNAEPKRRKKKRRKKPEDQGAQGQNNRTNAEGRSGEQEDKGNRNNDRPNNRRRQARPQRRRPEGNKEQKTQQGQHNQKPEAKTDGKGTAIPPRQKMRPQQSDAQSPKDASAEGGAKVAKEGGEQKRRRNFNRRRKPNNRGPKPNTNSNNSND